MPGAVFLGTSGFAYEEWRGSFYPSRLPAREMLRFYATRLNSVEINYTFRRQPSDRTVSGWRGATPDGFAFALKAPARITHGLRLAGADDVVSTFLEQATGLGPRLGPILFQCPPTLRHDRRLIESFLAFLPATFRFAFEFRHPSWNQARGLLAEQGAAWCVSETDEAIVGEESLSVHPFAFLRLRREGYTDEDLRRWARRIGAALAEGVDVYCYFKHEGRGAAPAFAERLRELL